MLFYNLHSLINSN